MRTLAALLVLLATAAPAAGTGVEDLVLDLRLIPLDGPAPPFTLPRLDGNRVSLSDFKGHVVLLYFWASW